MVTKEWLGVMLTEVDYRDAIREVVEMITQGVIPVDRKYLPNILRSAAEEIDVQNQILREAGVQDLK